MMKGQGVPLLFAFGCNILSIFYTRHEMSVAVVEQRTGDSYTATTTATTTATSTPTTFNDSAAEKGGKERGGGRRNGTL